MQRPRAPPPPRPAMRRSVSTLALQWSIDAHQPRASTLALSGLADLQLLSPSSAGSSRRRKRVDEGGERQSSPSARSTNDSLSSTLLTTTSSGVLELEWDDDDEEGDDDDDVDSLDSRRRPPLSDWVYWQRDVANHPECWTRVFAVYKAAQLWLYRYEVANAQTLLLHIPVTRVEAGADGARQLKLLDISAGREVRICMLDVPTYEEWRLRIRDDVYAMADERMEQRAERESGVETQTNAVVRTRQRSISGSHKGILRHALSTAVTNLKKSHSDPTGHLHRRELSTSASAPGFSTAPSAFPPPHSVQYKKSGWKSVKSKLSGVWKDKALHRHQRGERQQLEL